jgi:hypothetical protein
MLIFVKNYFMESRTIRGRIIYILLTDCTVLGTWTNLKQLCTDMDTEGFISYSKLSKEIATIRKDGLETPVFDIKTKIGKAYQIKVEKLK